MLHEEITSKIIKTFYKVNNVLGFGFLEKLCENAMFLELTKMDLTVERQKNILVYYENSEVGNYFADLLVNGVVIIELKAAENLCEEHEAQLINYLKATNIEVGLLLNFGKKAEFRIKYLLMIGKAIRENSCNQCHLCSIFIERHSGGWLINYLLSFPLLPGREICI
jgi:GxxExxY protein